LSQREQEREQEREREREVAAGESGKEKIRRERQRT